MASRMLQAFLAMQSVLASDASGWDRNLSGPARSALITYWDIQSTSEAGQNLTDLSLPGADVSSWHHVDIPRCTLMGCLIEAGVYNESHLFFSDNLKTVNRSQFTIPWLYRHEFSLDSTNDRHFFFENNGISSKADVFLNGHQIASNTIQAGAYSGHTYDITKYTARGNALLVKVYPTDYDHDFSLGFVDWNPYPPDNGTGIWRDVFIRQTGHVMLKGLRVNTDFDPSQTNSTVSVTVRASVRNLQNREIRVQAASVLSGPGRESTDIKTQTITIGPLKTSDLSLVTSIKQPALWWPKAWGEQPIYSAELSVSVDGVLSDSASTSFGIRKITSSLNKFNDTTFSVNGYPLQVIGAGYSADMFLRWDSAKFTAQAQYMLDMGLNTVRLEGKNEHPELYEIADALGLLVLPGWECCDKWEAWSYNEDLAVKVEWNEGDYGIANSSMRHEIAMLQNHPSVLGYLVGSDYWPDDKATSIYLQAFNELNWQTPIIASASSRGFPKQLGPSGMKMAGPYDWVPPNYWYDVNTTEDHLGAAFGFGSELGAGVGTPELSSLTKFLNESDMEDLWKQPDKGLFHMSTNVSSFYDRKIYNEALWKRLGAPKSLDDYLSKAQILDYEAARAQFESYGALWSAARPATGLIYWMLNNAWPSLHWNLFDYYLHPAGSYFGAKVGSRTEHVAYDYLSKNIYLIDHSLDRNGTRKVAVEAVDINGKPVYNKTVHAQTAPNQSQCIFTLPDLHFSTDVLFLRLLLSDSQGSLLSRNIYWLAKTIDTLDWDNSDWYYTPVTKYANFTALDKLVGAKVNVTTSYSALRNRTSVVLENQSGIPAFFIRLDLLESTGEDVLPVFWSDNYVTLWPHETLMVEVRSLSKLPKAIQTIDASLFLEHLPDFYSRNQTYFAAWPEEVSKYGHTTHGIWTLRVVTPPRRRISPTKWSSTNNHKPQKMSFPKFTDLPPELREAIWQAALPGPRTIQVLVYAFPGLKLAPLNRGQEQQELVLVLSQVCYESRRVVRDSGYVLAFRDEEDPRDTGVWFNPKRDVLERTLWGPGETDGWGLR